MNVAIGRDGAGAKCQRRHVSLADSAQAENEAQAACRYPRLIGVWHDARIEQCRRFERILVHEVGADELALNFGKGGMRREGCLHLVGTKLERLQQVAMPALEVLQHIRQLVCRLLRVEIENALHDMVGPRLVGRVEVSRFGRRLERAYDDACRVGAEMERLPIQECGVQRCALGWPERILVQARTARSATESAGLALTRAS